MLRRFLTDMLYLGGFIFWFMILCAVIITIIYIAHEIKHKKDYDGS